MTKKQIQEMVEEQSQPLLSKANIFVILTQLAFLGSILVGVWYSVWLALQIAATSLILMILALVIRYAIKVAINETIEEEWEKAQEQGDSYFLIKLKEQLKKKS